ncbi:MAG: hypothetical protein ABI164_03050, partial [Acidobacteriaceae bacterium]
GRPYRDETYASRLAFVDCAPLRRVLWQLLGNDGFPSVCARLYDHSRAAEGNAGVEGFSVRRRLAAEARL